MAKYVNISVISTLQLQTPYSDDLDSKISEMCDYLHKNIEQVLPDKPDLIVFCSMLHGSLMQQSWAYNCRAYFAGAIGIGKRSRILNPIGTQVSSSSNLFNHTTCKINLDYAVVHTEGHHNFHLPKIQNAKKEIR